MPWAFSELARQADGTDLTNQIRADVIAKGEPRAAGIELLHFVGGLLNNFAQFGVGDIL